MNGERIFKLYDRATLILSVLTFIGMVIASINEDFTVTITMSLVFPFIVFLFSIPGRFFGIRMLKKGDSITKGYKRTLFYISTVLISLGIFAAVAAVLYWIYDHGPSVGGLSEGIGRVLMLLFFVAASFILIFLPMVLTCIVLVLRRVTEIRSDEQQ